MYPTNIHKDPPHSVHQGHHGPHWWREQREATYHILRQYLERQQEQVWARRPHRLLVPSPKPTKHVGQRQEQAHRRAHNHVHLEKPTFVEHRARRTPMRRKRKTPK